jgi:hypothetical protein
MTWRVRVVVLRGEHGWSAQCLEIDLGAQGRSVAEALRALVQTFVGQALVDASAGKVPFADFRPAPGWYVEQYESGVGLDEGPAGVLAVLNNEPVRASAAVRIAADTASTVQSPHVR